MAPTPSLHIAAHGVEKRRTRPRDRPLEREAELVHLACTSSSARCGAGTAAIDVGRLHPKRMQPAARAPAASARCPGSRQISRTFSARGPFGP